MMVVDPWKKGEVRLHLTGHQDPDASPIWRRCAMKVLIEQQIRDVLDMEGITARAFNDALFGFDGLFSKLTASGQDRQAVVQSALFRQAQARLTELQRAEGVQLLQNAKGLQAGAPPRK